MNQQLNILILEDQPMYVDVLSVRLLEDNVEAKITLVETRDAYLKALASSKFDAIISDYVLPDINGKEALALSKQICPETPLIIFTGSVDEETAVECMKEGAADYVLKQQPTRLVPALLSAVANAQKDVEHKLAQNALQESERKYRELVDNLSDVIYEINTRADITFVNSAIRRVSGYEPEDLVGKSVLSFVYYEDRDILVKRLDDLKQGIEQPLEYRIVSKSGAVRWIRTWSKPIQEGNTFLGARGILVDITDRKQTEEALRQSEERLKLQYKSFPLSTSTWQMIGEELVLVDYNDAADKITRGGIREFMGRSTSELYAFQPKIIEKIRLCFEQKANLRVEMGHRLITTGEDKYWVFDFVYLLPDRVMVHSEDITERKRAEAILRESEKKYHELVNTLQEGIWVIDKDSFTTFVNPHMAKMLNYTVDEMQGKHLFSFMDDRGVEIAKLNLERRRQGIKEIHDFELLTKQGKRIHTSMSATPILDDNGNYEGAIAAVADVTDRKHAEIALRNSEQKYRNMFDFAPIGIYQALRDGSLLAANETLVELLAYESVDQLLGVNLKDIYLFPEQREKLLQEYEPKGFGKYLQIQWKRKDGIPVWVLLNAHVVKDENGMTKFFEGFVVDITERKKVADALRISEERYRLLAETSHDMITLVNRNWEVEYTNTFASDQLGIPVKDLTGKRLTDIFPPEIAARQKSNLQKVFETGKSIYVEAPSEFRGHTKWLGSWLVPIKDDVNSANTILVVSRDITDRRLAEDQLRALSARLQSIREEEKTRIAREIHDEFAQVLSALKMDLSFIGKHIEKLSVPKDGINSKIEIMMTTIDSTLNKVHEIISDLRPHILDNLGLVDAIEWYAEQFQSRTGIQCSVKTSNVDSRLDQQRVTALFRILQESLTNVARHSGAKAVEISLCGESDRVSLTVKDNGKGITHAQIADRNSLGILGMKERSLILGGDLKIDASLDGGTTVMAGIPFSK